MAAICHGVIINKELEMEHWNNWISRLCLWNSSHSQLWLWCPWSAITVNRRYQQTTPTSSVYNMCKSDGEDWWREMHRGDLRFFQLPVYDCVATHQIRPPNFSYCDDRLSASQSLGEVVTINLQSRWCCCFCGWWMEEEETIVEYWWRLMPHLVRAARRNEDDIIFSY